MSEYLFVYGTLRRGQSHPLARMLADQAERVGAARYRGRLLDLGDYPGVVPDPQGPHWVAGDLYRLRDPQGLLPVLDRYEGCTDAGDPSNEYRRARAEVLGPGDVRHEAWIYLYNRPTAGLTVIPGGDYLRR